MNSRRIQRGDAFDRALKESFGEQASLVKIEQARQLYARYRTDEILDRLKEATTNKNNEAGNPQL
jgi:hypothetical protein